MNLSFLQIIIELHNATSQLNAYSMQNVLHICIYCRVLSSIPRSVLYCMQSISGRPFQIFIHSKILSSWTQRGLYCMKNRCRLNSTICNTNQADRDLYCSPCLIYNFPHCLFLDYVRPLKFSYYLSDIFCQTQICPVTTDLYQGRPKSKRKLVTLLTPIRFRSTQDRIISLPTLYPSLCGTLKQPGTFRTFHTSTNRKMKMLCSSKVKNQRQNKLQVVTSKTGTV